jgi:hypothetical protein
LARVAPDGCEWVVLADAVDDVGAVLLGRRGPEDSHAPVRLSHVVANLPVAVSPDALQGLGISSVEY